MKLTIPYPLLLITAVILDRVVISSSQIDTGQSLRAMFILLLLTTLISIVIQGFIRDWHYTNFIVLMVWAALLAYRALYGFLKINFPSQATYIGLALILLLGIVFAVIASRKVWNSVRDPIRLTYYFNFVFTLLLGFQAVRLAKDIYQMMMPIHHSQPTAILTGMNNIHLQSKTRPDIYIIVLDGYARQDVLQAIYEHDNSEFIRQLETRGFFVANNSHSNYVQTLYSMSSFWNFDYLPSYDSASDYIKYLSQSIQNNHAFRLLDEIGYTTVSFEGELDYIDIKNSDVYLSNFLSLNKFEGLLLADSPLEPLSDTFNLGLPIPTYNTHRQRIQYELDTLKEIPIFIPRPKIVYAHILAPHPPFVFDQNGKALQHQQPYSLWDDSNYEGSCDKYWTGYRGQVAFINAEIIQVIDAILTKSETPPVIILMSDHGPASLFNWDFNAPSGLWERTSNLYSILVPNSSSSGTLSSSMSPVNTFRIIFNMHFGTNLFLLEDKTYLTTWHQPELKVDITNIRDSCEGCPISND
jgi:hypothetical protein